MLLPYVPSNSAKVVKGCGGAQVTCKLNTPWTRDDPYDWGLLPFAPLKVARTLKVCASDEMAVAAQIRKRWQADVLLHRLRWSIFPPAVSSGISVLAFRTEHCTPNRRRWCRPLGVFSEANSE
jgi:hypothetical protein